MRILPRGNSDGYFLLDALVSLFIATVAVIAVIGCVSAALRNASTFREHAVTIIESRNLAAQRTFRIDATE
jgi:Tfp pilus assembly protein PilV